METRYILAAAAASFSDVLIKDVLGQVDVGRLMSRDVRTLHPDQTLEDAVESTLSHYGFSGYPVEDEHHLEGLLLADDVRRVPHDEWPRLRVTQLMKPLDEKSALRPDEPVSEALEEFNRQGVGRLPVVKDGELVGILSQTDIVRWIAWHQPD